MTKTVVISQPRYMPALNYLQRMILADEFVFLDTVQYTPRDFENRNKIKTAAGPIWLSVPVIQDSREQPIKDIRVSNAENWQVKHLKSLQHAYEKAPFFTEHKPFLESVYTKTWGYLSDLNEAIIFYVCDYLKIECTFTRASTLDPVGKGEELLIDICRKTQADTYMSGSLGRNYIHPEKWQEAGLGLVYHDYAPQEYAQLHGAFVPWMGCFDLLFNHGAGSRKILAS